MLRSRFLWKLYAGFAAVILVSVCAVGYLVAGFITKQGLEDVRSGLAAKVHLLHELARPALKSGKTDELHDVLRRAHGPLDERVTIIRADGIVVADSDYNPADMDNHLSRDEVQLALRQGSGSRSRYSRTLRKQMTYYAESVYENDKLLGFVRSALPVSSIEDRLADLREAILFGGVIASALGLVTAFFFARRVTGRLVSVTAAAEAFAAGDYERRIDDHSSDEVGALAHTFNRMSAIIRERMETITEDRNKVITILRSMIEGVVAIDRQERVVQMNTVAAKLLRVSTADAVGLRIWEVTRAKEVINLLSKVLDTGEERHGELVITAGATDQVVELEASPLRDAEGDTVGALVLLHDVTDRRNLETMRRDFVANVSHELKTPLAAIRGLIETMHDDPEMEQSTRFRFLGMASRQTDRLSSLVTDLLTLSRLEAEDGAVDRRLLDVREPINLSIQNQMPTAVEERITLHRELPASPVEIVADPEAVRQVVDNLVVNAIKYTSADGHVWVRLFVEGQHAVVEVEDTGVGIDAHHLPRLFERFYRADKARSRELGGTGLGLAIVKHLMIAHNGDVRVESTPGVGSRFCARFPLT